MLKINLLFKILTDSPANNSRNFKTNTAKFPGYCFCMITNIYGDLQIGINVPLKKAVPNEILRVHLLIF